MNEWILLEGDGEPAAQAAAEGMTRHGLQVVRSFDLRTTRGPHGEQTACACPYHGTAECTCQYVVLLVYGETGAPATVLIHGRDSETRLKIVSDASQQPEASLVEQIMAALLETILQMQLGVSASPRAGTPAEH